MNITNITMHSIRKEVKMANNNDDYGFDMELGFDEESTVTLTLDDDTVVECSILTIFPVDGKDYIALLPLTESGEPNEEGEVFLYRYIETEDEEPELQNIESDDEYDAVADAFDELLDAAEYEELDED